MASITTTFCDVTSHKRLCGETGAASCTNTLKLSAANGKPCCSKIAPHFEETVLLENSLIELPKSKLKHLGEKQSPLHIWCLLSLIAQTKNLILQIKI